MSNEKRKKGSSTQVRAVSYSEEPSSVVCSFFNGITIPESTKFDVFKHKNKDEYCVHGDNERLNYLGNNENESHDYYIAVYDPIHKSVDIQKTPVFQSRVVPKSKRKYEGPSIKQTGLRNIDRRNALGEAFGTKKAKAAISNIERNRIDAEKLQDAEFDIVDSVKTTTETLPTRDQMNNASAEERSIPEPNLDATAVEDIYPLYNIIPKKEWSYLRVGALFGEEDLDKQLELLPYSKSSYISKRLPSVIKAKNTERLQMLFYASLLFGVYENRRVKDKQALMTRLENKPSEVLIDGIIERFTIGRVSSFGKSKDRSFVIDLHHEDKLLCYLIAILFHIDGFTIELAPLVHELNLKPTRLTNLSRALGAVVKSATIAQAEAFGIPKAAASSYKVATLKVPFTLPQISRRGRR